MIAPIKTITTPVAKAKIEIKDWITGEEAERIESALLEAVKVTPEKSGNIKFGEYDTSAINEQTHREIESFIISVDGVKENILKQALALPNDDYEFIKKEIQDRRKKKEATE
jgi:hypothetical protein